MKIILVKGNVENAGAWYALASMILWHKLLPRDARFYILFDVISL